jgi:hypothetical protein
MQRGMVRCCGSSHGSPLRCERAERHATLRCIGRAALQPRCAALQRQRRGGRCRPHTVATGAAIATDNHAPMRPQSPPAHRRRLVTSFAVGVGWQANNGTVRGTIDVYRSMGGVPDWQARCTVHAV